MNVLVTGGAGFIGGHIVEYLCSPDAEKRFGEKIHVRILDNFSSGKRENIDGLDCEVIVGDVTDRAVVKRAVEGVSYVFHLAALISVPESMQFPANYFNVNSVGTAIVLEECDASDVKKVVLSSSAALYGTSPVVPKVESMTVECLSPYAQSKYDGEFAIQMFDKERRVNACCLRYFNVFGPRQDPNSAYAAAIPAFCQRVSQKKEITIFGDGEQTRDFVFVKDVVEANVFVATHPTASGVFNVGYGESTSINKLAEFVSKGHVPIVHTDERAGDVKHSLASVDRLLSLGWKPLYSFEEGMTETLKFFLRN